MKFSISNLLAFASILIWATSWAATEKNASSAEHPQASVKAESVKAPQQILSTHAKRAND
ncbi:MAG TPA: hypothetical protein VIH99_00725 [Bdellovibrionota bacterium]